MKRFKKIYVEITNICNLKCSFCQVSNKKKRYMSLIEFGEVLDKIKPYTDYIYLHVKGEPLTHPEFEKIIELTKQKDFIVNITTNGTMVDRLPKKNSNIRVINFSLHSYSDINNTIDYENKLIQIIDFIKDSLLCNNTMFNLRFWNLTGDRIIDSERERNRQILSIIEDKFNLDYKINEMVTPGKNIKIAPKLFIHYDTVFDWPDMNNAYSNNKGFCYGLRDQAAILSDGVVVPCCLDGEGEIPLGNIFTEDFGDIIKNPRSNALFDGFSENRAVEPLCIRCSFKERFKKNETGVAHAKN